MNNFAERSDWRSRRKPLVFVLTKKVFITQRLKPPHYRLGRTPKGVLYPERGYAGGMLYPERECRDVHDHWHAIPQIIAFPRIEEQIHPFATRRFGADDAKRS